MPYPRGKGVGGTGNVNASLWSRGRWEDYTSVCVCVCVCVRERER